MTLRKPLPIFLSVLNALFLREMGMRMTTGKAGLFWTFFEPFAQVSIFVLIRVAIVGVSGQTTAYDMGVFMASGFIAFNMFKNILSSSSGAFTANKGLFAYKQVKPIDTIISRILVEMFLTGIIVLLFLFVGFLFGYPIRPENLLLMAAGYLWLVIFSFGIGLIVGIGNTFYVSIGKFVSIISFLLLIGSAVFFPLESLPPAAQEILLYNPLVHFMEMIHGAYLYELDDRYVDYIYMLEWTVVPLFVGLWLYIYLEKRIISK